MNNWLKRTPVDSFHDQRKVLFWLGHFISPQFPEMDYDTYQEVCRLVIHESDSRWTNAVASYQRFGWDGENPLKQDGWFGPQSRTSLQERFCSCPDRLPAGAPLKWGYTTLSVYHDMTELTGVSFSEAKDVYLQACQWVSAVTKLKFVWNDSPDVYAHAQNIDGRNKTLAWSYLPGSSNYLGPALEQRYDTSEDFGGSRISTFLRPVMAHELCHAFGLSHSTNPDDLMYAYMNGTQQLAAGDIAELQLRYGKPDEQPPDPVPPEDPATIKSGDTVYLNLNGQSVPFLITKK